MLIDARDKKWEKFVKICHLLLHILSQVEHDVAQLLPVDKPVSVLQNQNLKFASPTLIEK
jgi:hypothetical protein